MRIEPGNVLADREVLTVNGKVALSSLITKKTVVIFMRYVGCGFCQYDLMSLKNEYSKIQAAGGEVIAVLQSEPETMEGTDFPFPVILDPDQELYKAYEIEPAEAMEKMIGPKSIAKIAKVRENAIQHGKYEGNELQLPATFGLMPNLTVYYAHYSVEAGDTPTPDEVVELLQR